MWIQDTCAYCGEDHEWILIPDDAVSNLGGDWVIMIQDPDEARAAVI